MARSRRSSEREQQAELEIKWSTHEDVFEHLRSTRRVYCVRSLLDACVAAYINKRGSQAFKQKKVVAALKKLPPLPTPDNLKGLICFQPEEELTPACIKNFHIYMGEDKVSVATYLMLKHLQDVGEFNYLETGYNQAVLSKLKDKGVLKYTKPRCVVFDDDYIFPHLLTLDDFSDEEDILQTCMDNIVRRRTCEKG